MPQLGTNFISILRRPIVQYGVRLRSALLLALWLFTVTSCTLISGCRDEGTVIWSKEVRSPDGRWLATAATKQWSGPGNAYVATSVYLKEKDSAQPSVEVLGFSNDSAYPSGVTNVTMDWVTPKHLNVTYGSHATLDFQAVKCSGIDISVSDVSAGMSGSPQ
jgi:hypothetical protein